MRSFIEDIAAQVLRENESQLGEVTVIFPNRRAGIFFQNMLGQLIEEPLWLPTVLSMEEFVMRYSPFQKIETLEGVFQLYEVYKKHQQSDETFDEFFFWGEMILRDFDEIDQYLVNPQQLFTSIKTQKELDEEFYFLSEEDRATILRFWNTFLPQATRTQEAFLQTWKILLPLYNEYKQILKDKRLGYGGMIYRELAESVADVKSASSSGPIYFAGFNALTFAEEKIIKHFISEFSAQVIWDLDAYYFNNPKQEAGFFLRTYAKDPILGKTFPDEPPSRYEESKEFSTTGVSLEVGQTKALAEILDKSAQSPGFSPERTVIVLPKEHMLFPVLNSLPDSVEAINITMGYPLKDTPVFSLLESLLVLQNNVREDIQGVSFYYKPVVALLEHPLLFILEEKTIKSVIGSIKKRNIIRLEQDELSFKHPIFKVIFSRPTDPFDYMITILHGMYETWKERGHDLELEFISQFHRHIKSLQSLMGARASQLSYEFLIKLFRRLARSLKVPFTGEPLNGLQIMGILETRNLDFENVYILNMNEDSWPAPPKRGSFIPYNVRKAFDLPSFEHQDAIYSYLFYRLIQRARNVHMFYNTVSEFNVNGEISRLVRQLAFESGYLIKNRILANLIKTVAPQPILITKDLTIRNKMSRFLDGYTGKDASRFTPSALNTYLDCRLRFYLKYVEKLYEPDEVHEEMDPMIFGNILHNSMETLYESFMKKEKRDIVYPQDIFWIREGVSGAIKKEFESHYSIKNPKKFKLEGRALIASEVIKKFMNKILDYDQEYAPFKILGLEASTKDGFSLEMPISIGNKTRKVRMKGIIDRIDLKEKRVRVLDYKTGRDEKTFTSVQSLTDRDDPKRNKAVFQVFFYSLLFEKSDNKAYDAIEPGLFNSKDLFDNQFDWRIQQKEGREASIKVTDYRRFINEFEEGLTGLLTEIFDPEIDFDQTTDLKKCGYCAYKEICGR